MELVKCNNEKRGSRRLSESKVLGDGTLCKTILIRRVLFVIDTNLFRSCWALHRKGGANVVMIQSLPVEVPQGGEDSVLCSWLFVENFLLLTCISRLDSCLDHRRSHCFLQMSGTLYPACTHLKPVTDLDGPVRFQA